MLAWEFGDKALLKRLGNFAYGLLTGIPKQERAEETILHHPLPFSKTIRRYEIRCNSDRNSQ